MLRCGSRPVPAKKRSADISVTAHVPSDPLLRKLLTQLSALEAQVHTMDAATQAALTALRAELDRAITLEQANKTLLEGLNAKLAAGATTDPAVAAAITADTASLKDTNDKSAAAIVANTPA
jgi:hypothetical protein